MSFERSPDLPTGLRDPNSKWRGGSWEKGRGGRAVREGKGKGWGGGREGEGLDQLKYPLGKFAGRDQRSNHCATPPSGGLRVWEELRVTSRLEGHRRTWEQYMSTDFFGYRLHWKLVTALVRV